MVSQNILLSLLDGAGPPALLIRRFAVLEGSITSQTLIAGPAAVSLRSPNRDGIDVFRTCRIFLIQRIIADVGIPVEPVVISDEVGLEKPPQGRGIGPGRVVLEADLRNPGLAGALEAADIAGGRDALLVAGGSTETL